MNGSPSMQNGPTNGTMGMQRSMDYGMMIGMRPRSAFSSAERCSFNLPLHGASESPPYRTVGGGHEAWLIVFIQADYLYFYSKPCRSAPLS